MRYVIRNENGEIEAVYAEPQEFTEEALDPGDPELLSFVVGDEAQLQRLLAQTDQDLLRVLEDLINILVEKQVILPTDFPEAARNKLMRRRSLREHLTSPLL